MIEAIGAPQAGESEGVVARYRRRTFEHQHRKAINLLLSCVESGLRSFEWEPEQLQR